MIRGLSRKNRIKLKLVIVLTIATLLLSVFAMYLVINVKPEDDTDYTEIYRSDYSRLKDKNSDFLGTFTDEDFNIEIKVVKGEDNSKYLYYVWEKNNYSFEGSPCLDYENTLEDQNLILNNCHLDASNFDSDKKYYLFLKDEIREYELCAIFDVNLVNENGVYYPEENLQYNLPFYNSEYFKVYKENIDKINQIDCDRNYSITDRYFTLVNEGEDDYTRRVLLFVQSEKYLISDLPDILIKMCNSSNE